MLEKYTNKSLQAYFTEADDIRSTMIELLGDTTGKTLLEPCFGGGAFIKSLMGNPARVDAIDIDSSHFEDLSGFESFNFYNFDFIDYFVNPENRHISLPNEKYDLTICNPPYGLKFSSDYRRCIKRKFPEIYARESYGLFFYFALRTLQEYGRYVFIVPDSFMTSRNLKYIRKFMVHVAAPTHIIQFDSKRFESVNFGYSNMCIIAGYKKELQPTDQILWINAIKSKETLRDLLGTSNDFVSGDYLIDNFDDAWVHPSTKSCVTFTRATEFLGDLADCKTGIYTGNNKEFCGYDISNPPSRTNGHPVEWGVRVSLSIDENDKENGLAKNLGYVPFVRGGHREPFEKTSHCIRWDKSAVKFYSSDKKARLQNKSFYFKKGLAVPMVTSGRLSASEMSDSIFDQGVVGIFPKNEQYHDFLLIYLNHDIVSKLKSQVAPGANNSANYLKKIPVPSLTKNDLVRAAEIVSIARVKGWQSTIQERNDFVNSIL